MNTASEQERHWATERHQCLVQYLCGNPRAGRSLLDKWDKDPKKRDYAKQLRTDARTHWRRRFDETA